ncbi:MAG: hypothetical protein U0930_25925 [Pirellulales bacterium]
MKKSFFALALLFACCSTFQMGCSPASVAVDNPLEVKPADQIKAMLSSCLETGNLGSEQTTIEQAIEKMKSTDAAKAETIAKAFDALVKATTPAAKKSKAKEIIGLL